MMKNRLYILCLILALFSSCQEDIYPLDGVLTMEPQQTNGEHLESAVCEPVDLGLPSGIMWASCNVGATSPEEYGGYYTWGETEEKDNYSWETYIWCSGSYDTMTKYCTNSSYGTVDNKTVLDPEDDVAHVKWGGSWRMPTKAEQDELLTKCTWEWTSLNGVNGYKVTGPNGNSIFLPAAGYRDGTDVDSRGRYGYYRSSSLSDDSGYAYNLYFIDSNYGSSNDDRYYGLSVRPVCAGTLLGESYAVAVASGDNGVAVIENYDKETVVFVAGTEVTLVATPNEGYEFAGWYCGDSPVSHDATYTFVVEGSILLVAKFEESSVKYEAVDLGLRSGLKWATHNVGANSPEEYGGYYAWGETEEKYDYSWETYKWCSGSYNTITKYCTNSSDGAVDGKTVLDPEDDVAHVKWGGSWRMPTKAEQDELRNNCTWEWTTLNDVNGYKVTGPNGNSIFLPVAGFYDSTDIYYNGYGGNYWSSTLYGGSDNDACGLFYDDSYYSWGYNFRNSGLSVRPVCE